jgi:hypothetical protein
LKALVLTYHKNNAFNGFKASDRVLSWLLALEEHGVTFEYAPGKKNVVADASSHLEDIDNLKIQKEDLLTLLSGLENSSNSNIEFPMNTVLIFKEQAKFK